MLSVDGLSVLAAARALSAAPLELAARRVEGVKGLTHTSRPHFCIDAARNPQSLQAPAIASVLQAASDK